MTEWQELKTKTANLFKIKLPILLVDVINSTAMFVPKTKEIEYHDKIYVSDENVNCLIEHWNSKKKNTHFAKLTKNGWSHELSFIKKKPKVYTMFCEKSKEKKYEYSHFHPIELGVKMYGAKLEDIVEVKVSEDHSDEPKYFGWWDYQDQDFSMIYGHLGLVNMCFAYGPWAEIERGRGEICGVKIEEGKNV